jgi:hypothetical protein
VTGRVALLGLALIAVYFWWSGRERWQAIVYPNKNDLTEDIRLGELESLEQCRAAIRDYLQARDLQERADWECGLNCKPFASDMLMCEETLR